MPFAFSCFGRALFALGCAAMSIVAVPSPAQSTAAYAEALQTQLIGRPLYLRGFWNGYDLHFDAAGEPLGKVTAGPMTLSGVDVTSVSVEGKRLHLSGPRVVLVANSMGRLERRTSVSVTGMPLTVQRRYISQDIINMTVEADTNGQFDAALLRIFVEGDAGLATVAPSPWKCYASAYLAQQLPDAEAQARGSACVHRVRFDHSGEPSFTAPIAPKDFDIESKVHQLSSLGLEGTSRVHFTVGPHGYPTRLQVEQPVGAGVEEAIFQALSRATFQPATVAGEAEPQDFDLQVRVKP